ncbi:MAG: RICIN domain-containing protein, partial [Clostridia bacterium]|nr:RICIN domain-containing protein [Clostridia bacterium]
KTLKELKEMTLDVSSLPKFIKPEVAREKGHVNRLNVQETNLHTVIYQNSDGSKSTYIFVNSVKYIDKNGNVRDKSTQITRFEGNIYPYAMTDNDVQVYFPEDSGKATLIKFEDFSVSITPRSTNTSVLSYNTNDEKITYNQAFGANTAIVYKPYLHGLNEVIVLNQNVGTNEFDFELTATNLSPIEINGSWYLQNQENETIASLGVITVRDSVGNTVEGDITISSIGRNTYELTVEVPKSFLEADSTVYPVYVDSSTYMYSDNLNCEGYSEYNSIQDTGLYTTQIAVTNAIANNTYHKVGYNSSATGKVIYKLYDFYSEDGSFKELTEGQIASAKLHIPVQAGTATTFAVNPMTATWTGDNPTALCDSTLWNAYSENYASSATIDATDGDKEIDITQIIKGWARYNDGVSLNNYDNPANGFVLSSSSTSSYRNVAVASGIVFADVYISLDTTSISGGYYINNILTGNFLRKGSGTKGTVSKYEDLDQLRWSLEYIGNGKYYIRSLYNNYVLYGTQSTVFVRSLPTNPTDYFLWEVYPSYGGGVIIKNAESGYVLRYNNEAAANTDTATTALCLSEPLSSSDPKYRETAWGILPTDSYINLESFEISIVDWVDVNSTTQYEVSSVYPLDSSWANDDFFEWEIIETTVAEFVDDDEIRGKDNGYTVISVEHKPTGQKYVFTLVVGQMIPSTENYQIKNIYSGKYMTVEASSTGNGANIEQNESTTGLQQQWQFYYTDSGYYRIKSVLSNKYIATSSSVSGASIIQTSTLSDASLWKIMVTEDGNYKFISKLAESNDIVISLPSSSTSNGLNLTQRVYTDNTVYTDEWIISRDRDASLIAIPETYDRDDFFPDTVADLATLGYDSNVFADTVCMNHNTMLEHMMRSKVTIIRTHGSRTSIVTSNQSITVSTISGLPDNALANSDLIIYGACSTGEGEENTTNLVNETYAKGAKIVVGFYDSVASGHVNYWIKCFINGWSLGMSAEDAARYADVEIRNFYTNTNKFSTDSWYIKYNSSDT